MGSIFYNTILGSTSQYMKVGGCKHSYCYNHIFDALCDVLCYDNYKNKVKELKGVE